MDRKVSDVLDCILYPKLEYRSVKKDYSRLKNVSKRICAECGGECCKRCGCEFSPDDFKEISFEYLKDEMEKGYISIAYVPDEICYDPFGVYILRVRNREAPVVDLGYRRSPCILLTEKGCKLNYKDRPSGGKLLIPSRKVYEFMGEKKRVCPTSYGIRDCCYEWKPHQRIIHELIEYFRDKDVPCSL